MQHEVVDVDSLKALSLPSNVLFFFHLVAVFLFLFYLSHCSLLTCLWAQVYTMTLPQSSIKLESRPGRTSNWEAVRPGLSYHRTLYTIHKFKRCTVSLAGTTCQAFEYSSGLCQACLCRHHLALIHSFTHPLNWSADYLIAHSLIYSFSHTCTHSLTHSLPHSLTHSLPHSLTHSLTHPAVPAPPAPPPNSRTHPLCHSPTHSLTHSFPCLLACSLAFLLARWLLLHPYLSCIKHPLLQIAPASMWPAGVTSLMCAAYWVGTAQAASVLTLHDKLLSFCHTHGVFANLDISPWCKHSCLLPIKSCKLSCRNAMQAVQLITPWLLASFTCVCMSAAIRSGHCAAEQVHLQFHWHSGCESAGGL